MNLNFVKNKLMSNHEAFLRLTSDAQNESVQNFTRYLHDNAFDVLGKTQCNKNYAAQRKKTHNEWFVENCVNAQRDFNQRKTFLIDRNMSNRVLISPVLERVTTALNGKQSKYSKIKEDRRIHNMTKSQPKKFWQNIKTTLRKSKKVPKH